MKIFKFLLIILIAVMLTGCKSCNPVVPDITTEDLVGNWNFQSLEFNNDTIYGCDIFLNLNYDLITLTLKNVTTTKMTLFTDCMDVGDALQWEMEYSYTLSNDEITLSNSTKFQIVNVNDSTFKLKLISAPLTGLPLNGVYTLNK